MTSRVAPILDLIDTALADPSQHSPESDQYADVAPSMPPAGTCWRCTTHSVAAGSELCAGCRSYLLEDSEDDPSHPTPQEGWFALPPDAIAGPPRFAPGRVVAVSNPMPLGATFERFRQAFQDRQPRPLRISVLDGLRATPVDWELTEWLDPTFEARRGREFDEALLLLTTAMDVPIDALKTVLRETMEATRMDAHLAAGCLLQMVNAHEPAPALTELFTEPPAPDEAPPEPRNRAERRAERHGHHTTAQAGPRPTWTHRIAR